MYRRHDLDLLRELAVSQAQSRDQSTLLGVLWSFLHPVLLLAVLYVFFSSAFATDVEHYGLYLLIGLVHYTHFANTTGAALRTLGQMRELTAETVFPKELLVLSYVAAGSVEFVASVAVYLTIAAATGVAASWSWGWALAVVALQVVLVAWTSLTLAALYPFLADIDHLFQIFLRMLFFATPVFYEPSFVTSAVAKAVILLNPLAWLVEFARAAILEGRVEWLPGAGFLALNAVLVVAALRLFRALEPRFAEYV
jgi:lipopolysaccharide transport system permease protein